MELNARNIAPRILPRMCRDNAAPFTRARSRMQRVGGDAFRRRPLPFRGRSSDVEADSTTSPFHRLPVPQATRLTASGVVELTRPRGHLLTAVL